MIFETLALLFEIRCHPSVDPRSVLVFPRILVQPFSYSLNSFYLTTSTGQWACETIPLDTLPSSIFLKHLLESAEPPSPNGDQVNVLFNSVIDYCLDDRRDCFRDLCLDRDAMFLGLGLRIAHDAQRNFSCIGVVSVDLML